MFQADNSITFSVTTVGFIFCGLLKEVMQDMELMEVTLKLMLISACNKDLLLLRYTYSVLLCIHMHSARVTTDKDNCHTLEIRPDLAEMQICESESE